MREWIQLFIQTAKHHGPPATDREFRGELPRMIEDAGMLVLRPPIHWPFIVLLDTRIHGERKHGALLTILVQRLPGGALLQKSPEESVVNLRISKQCREFVVAERCNPRRRGLVLADEYCRRAENATVASAMLLSAAMRMLSECGPDLWNNSVSTSSQMPNCASAKSISGCPRVRRACSRCSSSQSRSDSACKARSSSQA
jgi:hypothetical protein